MATHAVGTTNTPMPTPVDTPQRRQAAKRLFRDYREITRHPLPGVSGSPVRFHAPFKPVAPEGSGDQKSGANSKSKSDKKSPAGGAASGELDAKSAKSISASGEYDSSDAMGADLNLFEWHCNITPPAGPYAGCTFHVILTFPSDYPVSPPTAGLCTHIPHPNVFQLPAGYYGMIPQPTYGIVASVICLDLLKPQYVQTPYAGWTSGYTVNSILMQMSAFLFDANVPQGQYVTHSLTRSHRARTDRRIER